MRGYLSHFSIKMHLPRFSFYKAALSQISPILNAIFLLSIVVYAFEVMKDISQELSWKRREGANWISHNRRSYGLRRRQHRRLPLPTSPTVFLFHLHR